MAFFIATLTGCATQPTPPPLNHDYVSPNQNSRIRTIVLHYTVGTCSHTLKTFTDPASQVSAQYVVSDELNSKLGYTIYQMVSDSMRAWHAGVSHWRGASNLNSESIGIEIVNTAYPPSEGNLPIMARHWQPFPDGQIKAVVALVQYLSQKYQIDPVRIVGHSDIAPGRKFDPGPKFPWKELYQHYQIGAWPNADAVRYYANNTPFNGDITSLQQKLQQYGYTTPQTGVLDDETRKVITAFQMHFLATDITGEPDVNTVATLDALLEKYNHVARPALGKPAALTIIPSTAPALTQIAPVRPFAQP